MDALSGKKLYEHVQNIASTIGPRPAGSRAEMLTRQYIQQVIKDIGLTTVVSESSFRTPKTIGFALAFPTVMALLANFIGKRWRWLGALLSLFSVLSIFQVSQGRRQPFARIYSTSESANLVVKIPPTKSIRKRVVLVAHTDTNKNRLTFHPKLKKAIYPLFTTGMVAAMTNIFALLFGVRWLNKLIAFNLTATLPIILLDEMSGYVDGANDNASAIACSLGIAHALHDEPLEDTEVWLAFTGAEEVGCVGMQHLLDEYREELADAWFIDFEMVGAGDVAYVTRHTGLSAFSNYTPDEESLALAIETARSNPQLSVRGVPMTIMEEVGTLQSRGFRGICLAGVGPDGWLVNWHRDTDSIRNINPRSLERAARFALAMIRRLDS